MEVVEDKEKQQKQETLKVLVADDDTPTRILLRAAISQWGYEAIEAKDGDEAWEIMQRTDAPRLMILDWLMPKVDGITLCERSKKELNYHPYIILLTQVTGTTNIIKGLDAGADEFLSKPFNMAELRSRLSIGARIIKYKNSLATTNEQLHTYLSQMESMTANSLKLSQAVQDTAKGGTLDANQLKLIQELHASLEKMIETVKKFELDSNTRS